ncbi:MAG TPA: hypothetical protein VES42_08020 [Pilimelia sp.]|nr:hypothetical protein [Pilimelia sp.]
MIANLVKSLLHKGGDAAARAALEEALLRKVARNAARARRDQHKP